jgi:hypothetical protein
MTLCSCPAAAEAPSWLWTFAANGTTLYSIGLGGDKKLTPIAKARIRQSANVIAQPHRVIGTTVQTLCDQRADAAEKDLVGNRDGEASRCRSRCHLSSVTHCIALSASFVYSASSTFASFSFSQKTAGDRSDRSPYLTTVFQRLGSRNFSGSLSHFSGPVHELCRVAGYLVCPVQACNLSVDPFEFSPASLHLPLEAPPSGFTCLVGAWPCLGTRSEWERENDESEDRRVAFHGL